MRSSRLRHVVIIQRKNGATWEEDSTCFAEIIPTGGAEGGAALNYTVTLRHTAQAAAILPSSDLSSTHRLAWGSKILDIFLVENVDQLNREIRLQCTELPAVAPE